VVGLLVEKPGAVAGHAHVLQRAGEPALLLGDVLKAQEAKPEELKAKQQRLLDSLRRDAGKAARSSLHGADTALRVRRYFAKFNPSAGVPDDTRSPYLGQLSGPARRTARAHRRSAGQPPCVCLPRGGFR